MDEAIDSDCYNLDSDLILLVGMSFYDSQLLLSSCDWCVEGSASDAGIQ